ncbi:MAG: hypothetical protein ACHQ6U_05155 [Thermodesulfobacteriota bacterium]
MSGDTASFIRSEGERLMKPLSRELFMNLTGKKTKSNISEIYNARREFLEPDLFTSFTESVDEEEIRGWRQISSFLADTFLGGNTSALADRIITLEASDEFLAAGKNTTIRSMKARIMSEPKKDRRDEIESRGVEILNRLNPLYCQKLEKLTECSGTLGFSSYANLIDNVRGIGIPGLRDEAAMFLKDTDYAAGDMLNWFFMKIMEYDLKDASFGDVMYFLNSAGLRGYFPKINFAVFPGRVLDQMGLIPSGDIHFDTERRNGKSADAFSIPVNPPFECAVSIYPVEGIHDYESLLGVLGCCSCFIFTEPDDFFESTYLRDETLTGIFSRLFVNLLYEPKWLKKYLAIDINKNFLDLLFLRRLMSARLDAARTLYAAELFGNCDPRDMPGMYSQIMGDAIKCRINVGGYLTGFLSTARSQFGFKALLAEPSLRNYLKESFDEEWWRTQAAGDFLRGIWSEGGRVTTGSLLKRCGLGEPDSRMLVRNFE